MNDQYVLMGHVVGESITFLVRIHPNEVLASLQEIIHEKKRRVFENVTADELIVYEVDSSSLKTDGRYKKRTLTEGQRRVGYYWPSRPTSDHIHFLVEKPIVKLHDLISSIADSKLISDDSLDKLQHRGARPIDRTLTLEELMDEMPFVGRDGDIRETITIIKDQFQLWLDISKSKQRLRNVKDVAILCCTGPSGIGKTTFGRYLRHTLAVQDGASEFEKAAQYGEKHNFLVRIAFDVDPVKIQEFQDPDRSLALRLLYAIIGSSLRDEQKYLTYYEFHDTYFNSSEPFNLRILLQQLAKQMPPGTMGILQIEFDETNSVLRDEQGIRYIVSIVQELNTSLFYSRSIFVSSLFSGTYSAELHSAVKRSASRISKISLTPLTAVEYQQSIGKLLELPPNWCTTYMWNLLSSLEYVPKLMVASLVILAHFYTLAKDIPSVLGSLCLKWKCNLAILKEAVIGPPHLYNKVLEIVKSYMRNNGLNMMSVADWLPGATTGIMAFSACVLEKRYMLSQTLNYQAIGPQNRTVGDLEKEGAVFLIPASKEEFDQYRIVFPFIYLHWMGNVNISPEVKLLQDYRTNMSSDENEISDVMMIMLRCSAYRALGCKSIKLNELLTQRLEPADDHMIALTNIDYQIRSMQSQVETAVKLPNLNNIIACKNASGATSWDSRINLPLAREKRSINIFVQSKLRLAGQKLSQDTVRREFKILSKWKAINPGSQIMMITCAEMAAHPVQELGIICIDKDRLDEYFGMLLGGRRRMMELSKKRAAAFINEA